MLLHIKLTLLKIPHDDRYIDAWKFAHALKKYTNKTTIVPT